MKSYLMIWGTTFATLKQITDLLDQWGPTWDWHSPMGNCLMFSSPLTAEQLAAKFEENLGTGSGRLFIIMEYHTNSQGRLTPRGWKLLQNPLNPRGK